MVERKLIQPDFIYKLTLTPYFAHYMTEQIDESHKFKYFLSNEKKLSKNNWKLHKQLVNEGVNPSEIVKAIRSDDLEKLQQISMKRGFNFDQKFEPSLYERYSFLDNWNVSLIDYAAFLDRLNVLDLCC